MVTLRSPGGALTCAETARKVVSGETTHVCLLYILGNVGRESTVAYRVCATDATAKRADITCDAILVRLLA